MKRFFVWKDKNCNGINPEWEEIDGKAFIELKKKNPERRFIVNYDEDEPEDDIFYYEATKEAYNEWNLDRMNYTNREKYFQRDFEFVSFDDLVEPEDKQGLTWVEIIPDTSEEDAEAERICKNKRDALIARLLEEIEKLPEDDKKLIYAMYLNPNGNVSSYEYAKQIGIAHQNVNKRKLKIFKKLRASMGAKK